MVLLRRTSFWPPSLVYISINRYIYRRILAIHGTGGMSIHWSSDVWLPKYPPMGADVGVFQVADVPMYIRSQILGLKIHPHLVTSMECLRQMTNIKQTKCACVLIYFLNLIYQVVIAQGLSWRLATKQTYANTS